MINIFMNNNPNKFIMNNQQISYFQNYLHFYQFMNRQYPIINLYYKYFNNINAFNDDKTISKMALILIKTDYGCHLLKEK